MSKFALLGKVLLSWLAANPRDMPWKKTKDPYKIWVSEIILQQTRVAQGTPYYLTFIQRFPTVFDLASASEEAVFKVWEGLGYYRRARHMHETAQFIVTHYEGVFPNTYEEILALKGIGEYSAAAIGSFAFGLEKAVVDGNVSRLISRLFGIEEEVQSLTGKLKIKEIAQRALSLSADPSQHNQAIMNFGAMVCLPKAPVCHTCPFAKACYALEHKRVDELPKKKAKKKRKKRYFHYYVIRQNKEVYLRRREAEDIWKGLYEFHLVETKSLSQPFNKEELMQELEIVGHCALKPALKSYKQNLTHREILASFHELTLAESTQWNHQNYHKIDAEELDTYPFPKVIHCYLVDKSITLFDN